MKILLTIIISTAISFGVARAQEGPAEKAKDVAEDTAETAKDSNSIDESICRSPNGNDTDNANVDWAACTTKTPGTANP